MARADGRELGAIIVGGMLGALLRVWIGDHFTAGPTQWPWAVFAINISGSAALA